MLNSVSTSFKFADRGHHRSSFLFVHHRRSSTSTAIVHHRCSSTSTVFVHRRRSSTSTVLVRRRCSPVSLVNVVRPRSPTVSVRQRSLSCSVEAFVGRIPASFLESTAAVKDYHYERHVWVSTGLNISRAEHVLVVYTNKLTQNNFNQTQLNLISSDIKQDSLVPVIGQL